mgnify:CR=1 FL=1
MVPNLRDRRVYVCVDGQNLIGSVWAAGYAGIDPAAFVRWARVLGRPTVEVFMGEHPAAAVDLAGYRAAGATVVTRAPKVRPDGSRTADMDVDIALGAVRAARTHRTVLLVSGDGHMVPLVHELRDLGCRVMLLASRHTTARALRALFEWHDVIDLATVLPQFAYRRGAA